MLALDRSKTEMWMMSSKDPFLRRKAFAHSAHVYQEFAVGLAIAAILLMAAIGVSLWAQS